MTTYVERLRAFRDTYGSEIAREYWDEAIDQYLDVTGPPENEETFLMAMTYAAAEMTVRVEIHNHIRTTLNMIPDYIVPNDDGTWTVMLYETQNEVKVGFGIMPALGTSRPVRDLINDPDYTV